jgi:hypothetical protein
MKNTRWENLAASPVMVMPPITRPAAAQAPVTETMRRLVSARLSKTALGPRRVSRRNHDTTSTDRAPKTATKVGE